MKYNHQRWKKQEWNNKTYLSSKNSLQQQENLTHIKKNISLQIKNKYTEDICIAYNPIWL